MAVDLKPPTWIAGWDVKSGTVTLAAQSIVIPIASLSGMTAGLADATTGDIRACLMSILHTVNAYWLTKTAAELPQMMMLNKTGTISTDPTIDEIVYLAKFSTTVTTALRSET